LQVLFWRSIAGRVSLFSIENGSLGRTYSLFSFVFGALDMVSKKDFKGPAMDFTGEKLIECSPALHIPDVTLGWIIGDDLLQMLHSLPVALVSINAKL